MVTSELKRYIYENNKIVFILEQLGCHHIYEWSDRISAANPDGDNKTAVNVYKNEYLNTVNYTRNIESDGGSSDILSLIQYYKDCDFRSAVKWVHKILGLKLTYSTQKAKEYTEDPTEIFKSLKRKQNKQKEIKILDEDLLLDYEDMPYKDFVESAKITLSTIKKFGLGYSYNARRTIIPVRLWLSGELIGIRGRTSIPNAEEFDIPKYFPLKAFPTGDHIYGLYENYDNIIKSKKVVVFEGEKSVLTIDTFNKYIEQLSGEKIWAVSIFGHELSNEQACILARLNLDEIIFAFDKDMPERISHKACDKLYNMRNVSYIFDQANVLEEKDAPIDRGVKTFIDLYRQRIPYDEALHDEFNKKLG